MRLTSACPIKNVQYETHQWNANRKNNFMHTLVPYPALCASVLPVKLGVYAGVLLAVGMAFLSRRTHVAMSTFIWRARRKALPETHRVENDSVSISCHCLEAQKKPKQLTSGSTAARLNPRQKNTEHLKQKSYLRRAIMLFHLFWPINVTMSDTRVKKEIFFLHIKPYLTIQSYTMFYSIIMTKAAVLRAAARCWRHRSLKTMEENVHSDNPSKKIQ